MKLVDVSKSFQSDEQLRNALFSFAAYAFATK